MADSVSNAPARSRCARHVFREPRRYGHCAYLGTQWQDVWGPLTGTPALGDLNADAQWLHGHQPCSCLRHTVRSRRSPSRQVVSVDAEVGRTIQHVVDSNACHQDWGRQVPSSAWPLTMWCLMPITPGSCLVPGTGNTGRWSHSKLSHVVDWVSNSSSLCK